MGQGYEDHLITPEDAIPNVDKLQWKKIDAQPCSALWQSVGPKILLYLRAYKTCSKFWNQAKVLYTNDIQRLYKVASAIVNIRQQDMDLSNYIGQIAFLKEEFLTLMPLTRDIGAQQTQIDKFFMVLTLIALSLAILVIVVISYMDGLLALPTWPSLLILILNRPRLRAPPHLRVFPPLTVSMMNIFAIRQPSQLLLHLLPRPVMPLPTLLIHLLLGPGF